MSNPTRVLALLVFASLAVADEPPARSPRPRSVATEIERFRGLEPGERFKLIEKLAGANDPFTTVSKGDLVASVVERGVIECANSVDLVCKVKAKKDGEAATTIKWVIDDGALVKKGDKLLTLDDAAMQTDLKAAAAKLREAEAALRLTSEIAKTSERSNTIEVRLAEIALKLAQLELKDAPSEKAKAVLELKAEAAKLKVDLALTRAKASETKGAADVAVGKVALEKATAKLKEIEVEIANCVLVAPCDGLAVYLVPTSGRFAIGGAIVAPGEMVREGQKLLHVADLKEFVVATRIHEAVVSAVRLGQATVVRVDAYPNTAMKGKVTQIAAVAAPSDWQRTDVKVYPVTIALEETHFGLKPGMSAEIHIEAGTRKGVLQVPVEAIVSTGREMICFAKEGKELVERKVLVGVRNANAVEIREGLKGNDIIVTDLGGLLGK